jgi:phosphopantetheinyl transferase (holo-ACP synthase)
VDQQFIEKILLPNEQLIFSASATQQELLWIFWTIKEAAYKLSCFLGNRNKFHATQFEVKPKQQNITRVDYYNEINEQLLSLHRFEASVRWGTYSLHCLSMVTTNFIHSVAIDTLTSTPFQLAIAKHTRNNKDDYSREVRNFAQRQLVRFGIDYQTIQKDKDGIPYLVYNNNTERYISLSHDNFLVSFAFAE